MSKKRRDSSGRNWRKLRLRGCSVTLQEAITSGQYVGQDALNLEMAKNLIVAVVGPARVK